jgi:hypothetical protein
MACGCAQHVRGMATWGLDVALRCMVGLGLRTSAKGNLGIDISVAVPKKSFFIFFLLAKG